MKKNELLLNLDLQFFAGDEFDIEAADQLIEQEDLETDIVVDEDETLEVEDELELEGDDSPDTGVPDLSNDDGRDVAFAELRRERDRLAAEAAFIQKFAEDNGMTVEQLKEQYEAQRLEKEAESKGVPVDVLKRISTLESENEEVKAQAQAVRFNAQVDATLAKYQGTQEDFQNTVKYVQENGMLDALKNGSITFEAAYKLANLDTMIESAKKNAVQDDLATRKKRQQEAPIAQGAQAQAAVADDDLDSLVEADTKAILADMGF